MNGYRNEYDDDADEGAEYAGQDHRGSPGDGYGEAEARRQAQAYHARANRHAEPEGYEAEAELSEPDDDAPNQEGQPRESRKQRRRREAAERQARAEAEAAAMTARGDHEAAPAPVSSAVTTAGNEAATGKTGKMGGWFGKRGGEDRMAEKRSGAPRIDIVLPTSDRIDPNALAEFGLDPNTLAAMGMDPATLPQFEPEFLVELGINPQIVVEILRRQKLADMDAHQPASPAAAVAAPSEVSVEEAVDATGEAPRRKFDMSPAAWIGRYRKVQKWAPAAAAAAGLTTTGSIWFMSGGSPETPVEQVKNEQLAGEKAESALGQAVAKEEEPGIVTDVAANSENTAAHEPKADTAPVDPAAAPVALAMNDLPALPATDVDGKDAGMKPPDAPAAIAAEAPPGSSLPDAPPGLPADSLPALPPTDAAGPEAAASPPAEAAPPGSAEPKSDAPKADERNVEAAAKALAVPALGGLGAAAALAGSKPDQPALPAGGGEVGKPTDAMPELPKSPDPVPAEAPPGIPAPATEAPPGVPDAKAAGPMPEAPPGLPEPAEPPAEGPNATLPSAVGGAKTVPGAASGIPKAAAIGAAAGLGAGLAADGLKTDPNPAETPELPKTQAESPAAANEPPAKAVHEPPPPAEAAATPPGSLAGLPNDIPPTPETAGKLPEAESRGKPSDADANGPSIPNSRGKLLRSLSSTTSGGGFGRTAAAAAAGTGLGLAMGAATGGNSQSGESVQVVSAPAFDSAPPDIAPIRHTVQPGENFWTISRDYYGSGRYYKALWAANAARVGKIDELHVGDVVQIPAMENLDKSLIDGSNVAKTKRTAGSESTEEAAPDVARSRDARAVRTRNEIESVPIGGEPGQKPARKSSAAAMPETVPASNDSKEIISKPVGETASSAGVIRHRVRPGDTLRTIAAERLGNARRAQEIVELNADLLDDVRTPLEPDMVLKLPAAMVE